MSDRPNTKPSRSEAPAKTWPVNPLVHCRRLMLRFLQGLFAQAPKGHFKWASDAKASELVIVDNNPIRVDEVGAKPCINCTRSPVQFAGLFVDDFQHYHLSNNQTTIADLISGNLAINCLSRHDAEAEYLGWICARHIWVFRKRLIQQGFHDIGRKIQVTAATAAGALVAGKNISHWRKVTVVVPFYFRYSDKIQPVDLPTLNNVKITANVSLPTKQTETPILVQKMGTSVVGRYDHTEDYIRTTGQPVNSSELKDNDIETKIIETGD